MINRMKSSKITQCAILSALAIVFGYIEMLIPLPVALPGVKWGLGNIVVLVAIYMLGKKYAFFIMLIKVFVSSLLFSAPSVMLYSLSGGVLSFVLMTVLKKYNFHIITVSIGGGIFHNIGQLICASIMMRTLTVFSYLPILVLCGVVSAVVTGICASVILKRIKKGMV